VTLAAQIHALGFYERAEFHVAGDLFMDAGIPQRLMVRDRLLRPPVRSGDNTTLVQSYRCIFAALDCHGYYRFRNEKVAQPR
jgi:hypothetical protein